MRKILGLRWAVGAVAGAALLLLVAACGAAETEVVEVVKEVVVEKEVVKEVVVEKIVEVEVIKEVPVEKQVIVEKEVVKEVPVEVIVVVEKEVVKEVEVEVVKEVEVEKVVVREIEKIVVATPLPLGSAPWMISLSSPETRFGGHLIHGTHGPMSHFDLFQSGSIANIGPQGPMYDSMLRVDPHHPMTPVVGDLAHRWDISADGMKYTFNIREGVKFHDGTDLTSEDVLASLNRIIFPETFQKGLFARAASTFRGAVASITAPDDYTIQFNLSKPRGLEYIMGNLANGFNVVTTKEVLDANKGDLKKVDTYPGTGPYVHVSRDSEKWVQDKFADYWNPNAGFLDKLTNVWFIAYSAPMAAAMEGGAVDFADYIPPGAYNTMLARGHGGMEVYSGFITSIGFNNGKAPTDDKRVRKAFALVIDAPALNIMTEDIQPRQRAGWFDVGTPFARSLSELDKIPGFRSPTADDLEMAKQLLIDAGYPGCEGMPVLEIPTRDLPDARILVPAVQAMLKQRLGCESNTSIHQTSAIGEVMKEGKFHIIPSTMGSHGVPGSAAGAALKKCDEPNNTLRYCNRDFDNVVDAFLAEPDAVKADALKLKIRDFWDEDWPWLPHGETPIQYGWYNWVKGFPSFSVSTYEKNLHKLDWVWTTQSR